MLRLLKRRRLWVSLLLVAVIAAGVLMPATGGRICQANFDKIQNGWTEVEVLQVIGAPSGLSCDNSTIRSGIWCDRDGAQIDISFGRDGRVKEKSFAPSALSAFEVVKRTLERRIRAFWTRGRDTACNIY